MHGWNAGGPEGMPRPTFIADLTHSLTPRFAAGSPTPTFSRASVATVMGFGPSDNAGSPLRLLTVDSGEARFQGARRVSSGVWSPYYADGSSIEDSYLDGYLAEAAVSQLVTPTASIRDMTNAAWVKTTMTTALTITGIDGATNSATRCTATGANATVLQTLVAAASSRTYSCYVRRVTGSGTILLVQGGTTTDITSLINSTTYTLVSLTASILNVAFGIQINTSGDAIDVDCNQFESGWNASSRILTAGAARVKDSLTYAASGNSGATGSSMSAESKPILSPPETANTIVALDDNSTANIMSLGTWTSGKLLLACDVATVNQAIIETQAFTSRVRAKSVGRFFPNDFAVILNNGTLGTDTSGTTCSAACTHIRIGDGKYGANEYDGAIRNVRIYSVALTEQQMRSL
jgi:hypothetical protein